jgi:hypothetical protein
LDRGFQTPVGKTPSLSPENSFILRDGTKGVLCEEPTVDNQIFYSLFAAFDKAAKILGKDDKDDKVAALALAARSILSLMKIRRMEYDE